MLSENSAIDTGNNTQTVKTVTHQPTSQHRNPIGTTSTGVEVTVQPRHSGAKKIECTIPMQAAGIATGVSLMATGGCLTIAAATAGQVGACYYGLTYASTAMSIFCAATSLVSLSAFSVAIAVQNCAPKNNTPVNLVTSAREVAHNEGASLLGMTHRQYQTILEEPNS